MEESLFEHYVLGGGWAMLVLVPASIVALATILRASLMLWGRSVHRLAAEVRATVTAQKKHGPVALTDARVIAMDTALHTYLAMQPLVIIYAAAPFVGALGTAMALHKAWRGPVSLQARNLGTALENAFVPLCWGLGVALLAITGYVFLKARLASIERNILAPAAVAALNEPVERIPGERRL